MRYLPPAIQAFLFLIVVLSAFYDLKERRVPNWITLPGVVIAIALNLLFVGTPGLVHSLEGAGLAMLVYFPLYLLRGMGAGDVKLMTAVGAAAGWTNWLAIFVLTGLCGGIFAIVLAVRRGRLRETLHNTARMLGSLLLGRAPYRGDPALDVKNAKALRLPHAVAIAFGTLGYLTLSAVYR